MLSKIIIKFYTTLIEVSIWLVLLLSLIAGWNAGGFMGSIGGLLAAFIFVSMFFGAFLVIDDIRKKVDSIESMKNS